MPSVPVVRSVLSRAASVCAILGCMVVLGPAAMAVAPVARAAAPQPVADAAKDLDFHPSELHLWKDPESGQNFWYFTYELVNNTGKDQRFAPRIELVVDDGRIVRQGDGVPSRVNKDLKDFLKNPLLEDQYEILGVVRQGKPYAKTGLVVFKAEDLNPTELSVMVQGLSRDTEKRKNPKSGADVTLRKTARVDYLVPGDPRPNGRDSFSVVSREWIFR